MTDPYKPPAADLVGYHPGYKPAPSLTMAVVVLVSACAVSEVLVTIGASLLGGDSRADEYIAIAVSGLVAVLVAANLTSNVVFLVWIYRANSNASALGAAGMAFTPVACVLWWFVPFANFVMPYRAMREIYQTSDPESDNETWDTLPVPPFVGVWWIFFLGDALLGYAEGFGPAASLVTVVNAVLAAKLVRSIHHRQEVRAGAVRGAEIADTAPPLLTQ